MTETYIETNISQLLQKIEEIENFFTDSDIYGAGLEFIKQPQKEVKKNLQFNKNYW